MSQFNKNYATEKQNKAKYDAGKNLQLWVF